jgi:hypothetical protein
MQELYSLFVLGLAIGAILMYLITHCSRAAGTLKIDRSNPERDKYLFVIDTPLEKIPKKKKIILKIDPNADLSQK